VQTPETGWLLLIYQLPPKPDYLRVKVWRRLQRIGAVCIKGSVYVLPKNEETQEDLQWTIREIAEGGGEGTLCEARFVEGLDDEQLAGMFHAARDADYAQIAEDGRQVSTSAELARLKKRFTDVVGIDYLEAPGRAEAASILDEIDRRIHTEKHPESTSERPRGRTWVTRKGIFIDRMASAWLIRRFIDRDARFEFVSGKSYRPREGELRFDMFEGEYTHEGDLCTFEVLIARFGFDDRGLVPIAEVVHDIDLKDGKFGRPETAGIERLAAAIAMAHKQDEARLLRSAAMFDDLYHYFSRKGDGER
jgi:hypothetical protein